MLTKQLKTISRFVQLSPCSSFNHSTYNSYTKDAHPDVDKKKILIIGANGNLGSKLTKHWMNTHELLLVDRDAPTPTINQYFLNAELMHHHIKLDLLKDCNDCSKSTLSKLVSQSDVIIHFAANHPFPDATWNESMDTTDMITNTLLSCTHQQNLENNKKTRIIFASSNHCMGGYRREGGTLSTALQNGFHETALFDTKKVPLNPATKIELQNGYEMDATAYAMAKVFGERLSLSLCNLYPQNIEAVILRIGWNQPGENLPSTLSAIGSHLDTLEDEREKTDKRMGEINVDDTFDDIDDCEDWFRHMWLSNVDFVQLFDCAVNYKFDENISPKYTICNGVSNNSNSRWCIQNDIGYKPKLNVNDYDKQNKNINTKQPIENIDFD